MTTLEDLEYKFTDIEITPRKGVTRSPYGRIIDEFILSGKKSCIITIKHPEKLNSVVNAIRDFAKRNKLPVCVGKYGHRQIYMVRTEVQ